MEYMVYNGRFGASVAVTCPKVFANLEVTISQIAMKIKPIWATLKQ
jgi:hypothetical protein